MAGAVRLVLDEGKPVGAVVRDPDLTPSSLGAYTPALRRAMPWVSARW